MLCSLSLQAKKAEFQEAGRDASELVLFHGTSGANTHAICTGNFNLDLSNRFAYGRGIYFSKCPNTSLQYGDDLILCRVLPGLKEMTVQGNGKTNLQPVLIYGAFHPICRKVLKIRFWELPPAGGPMLNLPSDQGGRCRPLQLLVNNRNKTLQPIG